MRDSRRKVSEAALRDGEVRLYPAGATLLVGIGATVGVVANAACRLSANQQINILVPAPAVDPVFLTLAVAAIRDQIRLAAGAATLPIINQEKTGKLLVAAPDFAQQVAVRTDLLGFRTNIDELTSNVQTHIERLREYRSSLISAAVTGQMQVPGTARSA